MAVVFAREVFVPSLAEEMVPLFVKHFGEIARFKDIPLKPNLAQYYALENAGCLRVYTARHDGCLVGYSVFTLARHPHFADSLQANEELLYLEPNERKGRVGVQFIDFCDSQLAADGAEVIYHSVRTNYDYSELLRRRGYELVDWLYARRIR